MPWDDEDLEDGPTPLWFQLAARLRAVIDGGEFAVGDVLPAESALDRRFGVSRTTARAALNQLEYEGRIIRRAGKGSIVLPPHVDQPLNLLASFAEDMRARGLRPSYVTRSVRRARVTVEASGALAVKQGSRAIMIERLLCADENPLAVSTSWLAPSALAGHRAPTVDELDRRSLYAWLEDVARVRIAVGEEFIEAALADVDVAQSLHIPIGSAVLLARRISRTANREPVEYAVLQYRADRYRFKVELARP